MSARPSPKPSWSVPPTPPSATFLISVFLARVQHQHQRTVREKLCVLDVATDVEHPWFVDFPSSAALLVELFFLFFFAHQPVLVAFCLSVSLLPEANAFPLCCWWGWPVGGGERRRPSGDELWTTVLSEKFSSAPGSFLRLVRDFFLLVSF